jgi:Ca2+-binding EF-hand superfamily protein
MRTRTKVMLAVGALALGTTTIAGAGLAGGRGGGYHHGGWGGGERLFEQFDANQDGLITQAEIDQVQSSRLAEFDQNDDGSLTLEEYQAMWLDAMRERMVDRFQAHDDDGDAVVTVEEFVDSYSSIVRRLDRNEDGQLTRDDLRRQRDRDDDED